MTTKFTTLPLVAISWGEFFDRLTILEIKLVKITDVEKRKKLDESLNSLIGCGKSPDEFPDNVKTLHHKLKEINSALWEIEDGKRDCERRKDFGPKFVDLARSVYIKNDMRAQYKREIDLILDSKFIEIKSHESY